MSHDSHLKHAHNASPYATASSSVVGDSQSERGEAIARAELGDPKYTASTMAQVKFAVASHDVNGDNVRSERRPPPYGDGSDVVPNHLERHRSAHADTSADNDGVPFVVRAKGPAFGVGEQ